MSSLMWVRRGGDDSGVTALVGIDVGTTGVKALALSDEGDVLGASEQGYPLSTPRPGWSEQDPDDWVAAAGRALHELGVTPSAVGYSGQMHGLVCLDAADRVLRPAILWNDQRTAVQCEEIERRLGRARLVALTGNRALPGFTAPKLLWLREHEPDVYARITHVLLPKDYVRFRLSGQRTIDLADASGTLLLDVAERRWSDEVLAALEIPREWLPELAESTAVGAAGDQAAGAVGVGAIEPGLLSVVLGTSGVVFASLPRFVPDPQGRAHVFCHAVPGTWHAMGVMLSAAASLAWLQSLLDVPYETLLGEAERAPAGADDALFAPYLSGERTPHADPDVRAAFVGLSAVHGRGSLVRAVLEGVAYGLRDALELLRGLGVDATRGRISGGGARGDLWPRIVASTLAVPLERAAVDAGAAFGAALLGGVAAGVFADVREAVEACVRVRETVEPDPDWAATYREGYARFRELYPGLKAVSGTASPKAVSGTASRSLTPGAASSQTNSGSA
jgi:xylulokinase